MHRLCAIWRRRCRRCRVIEIAISRHLGTWSCGQEESERLIEVVMAMAMGLWEDQQQHQQEEEAAAAWFCLMVCGYADVH